MQKEKDDDDDATTNDITSLVSKENNDDNESETYLKFGANLLGSHPHRNELKHCHEIFCDIITLCRGTDYQTDFDFADLLNKTQPIDDINLYMKNQFDNCRDVADNTSLETNSLIIIMLSKARENLKEGEGVAENNRKIREVLTFLEQQDITMKAVANTASELLNRQELIDMTNDKDKIICDLRTVSNGHFKDFQNLPLESAWKVFSDIEISAQKKVESIEYYLRSLQGLGQINEWNRIKIQRWEPTENNNPQQQESL